MVQIRSALSLLRFCFRHRMRCCVLHPIRSSSHLAPVERNPNIPPPPRIFHSLPPSLQVPPTIPNPTPTLFPGMDMLDGSPRLMIVSDLDFTMVDHDDPENMSLLRFNALWESNYRHDSLLVFSSGRSPELYRELWKMKPLLTPDITVFSVGTEITYGEAMVPDDGWEGVMNYKWNREVVLQETAKYPQLTLQPSTEQRPHKVSFYVQKAEEMMDSLAESLKKRGLDVKLVYSSGKDLDVLPRGAGKGQALAYLLKKFKKEGRTPVNTLVCGDSGNDADLFTIPEVHGVMVSNAREELLKWHAENAKGNSKIIHATERCAAGIIQAVGHFALGPDNSPRDVTDFSDVKLDTFSPGVEVVKLYLLYERWCHAEVENSKQLIENLKQLVHPTGVIIHPTGVERSLCESLDILEARYGNKQGKEFSVWLDKVSLAQMGSDSWLVKFDKWEMAEGKRQGCLNTVLLNSKPKDSSGFVIVHIHQTWLDGYAASDPASWVL